MSFLPLAPSLLIPQVSHKYFPQIFTWFLQVLFLLTLAAGLEFLKAKVLTDANESDMNHYFLLTVIEEIAEFLDTTLLVWVHNSYTWYLQKYNSN